MSNAGSHWASDVWQRKGLRTALVRDVLRLMGADAQEFARLYDNKRRLSQVARARRAVKARLLKRAMEAQ